MKLLKISVSGLPLFGDICEIDFVAMQRVTSDNAEKMSDAIVTAITGDKKATSSKTEYYPAYKGNSYSIVAALNSLNINSSKENRKKIAKANGIKNYSFTAEENIKLLALLRKGKLKKV